MNPHRKRVIVRWIHLLVATALGLLVYLPPTLSGGLRIALMIVGVPLAGASGLYLWQQARLRRLLDHRRQRRPDPAMAPR